MASLGWTFFIRSSFDDAVLEACATFTVPLAPRSGAAACGHHYFSPTEIVTKFAAKSGVTPSLHPRPSSNCGTHAPGPRESGSRTLIWISPATDPATPPAYKGSMLPGALQSS